MRELLALYKKNKNMIKIRLREFDQKQDLDEVGLFAELCFCILTPQSKAVECDKAINELKTTGKLIGGDQIEIASILKGRSRFHNNKSKYIVAARDVFMKNKKVRIRRTLDKGNIVKTRKWLVDNIKGLGYKEASHFLRNLGFGRDMAILDVHILRNMKTLKLIPVIPKTMSEKKYLQIEDILRKFSKSIKIPLGEIDLLFWSKQTGYVFK